MKKTIFLVGTFFITFFTQSQVTVSTLAGSTRGFLDGIGVTAQFNGPVSIATDTSGNVYVADTNNQKIRKITPAGIVTTLAGSTQGLVDGNGTGAKFNFPQGITVDTSGNIFVADTNNYCIRKITPTGIVSIIAGAPISGYRDGMGTNARFGILNGIAIDSQGTIYVSEPNDMRIRKITSAGLVTTFAGGSGAGSKDGVGTLASFKYPQGLATDVAGNIYVADTYNMKIRKITPAGVVTTLVGSGSAGFVDGTGTVAQFNYPSGVATDLLGNVYVTDEGNGRIRKITPTGIVTTLAGSGIGGFADGNGSVAQFNNPRSISIDPSNNVYIGDYLNHKIRKITANLGIEENNILSTVMVYPNPAKDHITLDFGSLADVVGYAVKVTNILGQELFNKPIDRQQYTFPVNSCSGQGMCFVNVIDGQGHTIEIKKIILQ